MFRELEKKKTLVKHRKYLMESLLLERNDKEYQLLDCL